MAEQTGQNLVSEQLGCPACGERDADNLDIKNYGDKDNVQCFTCGNAYLVGIPY